MQQTSNYYPVKQEHFLPLVSYSLVILMVAIHFLMDHVLLGFTGRYTPYISLYSFSFHNSLHEFKHLLTSILSMFGHSGAPHLFSNLLFFIFVAPSVERKLGHLKTLLIFLISGIAANFGAGVIYPVDSYIGASGALSGLMAVYPFVQKDVPGTIISGAAIGFWFLSNFQGLIQNLRLPLDNTAFEAHIAGAVAGLIILAFYNRNKH